MPETANKAAARPSTSGENPVDPAAIWERLTAPFPEDWVEKLPKQLRRDDRDKSACRQGTQASADGHYCGGYHARAVHLDYVGHAGITMRLNDVLGPGGWDFQPYALTDADLPQMSTATFYARLVITVGGEDVVKWDLAANFNGPQEAYGDALRRCAMRFGIGTYLWSKSEHAFNLAKEAEPEPEPEPHRHVTGKDDQNQPVREPEHVAMVRELILGLTTEERDNVGPWWENAAKDGHLPERTNLAALTPPQAIWVRDTVAHMRQVAADAQPEEPSMTHEEAGGVSDPS